MCPSRVSPPRRAGQPGRAWAAGPGHLAARGQVLPLRAAAFDAAIHTDVLCCLRPKLATLRATFQALRHGGRTAFTAIFPAAGLTAAEARRAIEAGPPNCGLRTSYPSLLRSAGFVDVEERDLTADYLATASRKLDVAEQFAGDMIEMLGRQEYERDASRAQARHRGHRGWAPAAVAVRRASTTART